MVGVCLDSRSAGGKVFVVRPQAWAWPPGYVDSFWLTALPPLSIAEALRLLVGVPLPERENSVKSWRDGSLYIATAETQEKSNSDTRSVPSASLRLHFLLVLLLRSNFRIMRRAGIGFRMSSCLGCGLILVLLGDCG